MPIVIDASAAVELVRRSATGRAVREAIEESDAFAPELLDAEMLAAFRKLELQGNLASRIARRAPDLVARVPITRVSHGELLRDAWSSRPNLKVYDALYVALARKLGCALITTDGRLARAPRLGIPVIVFPSFSGP